MALTRPNCSGTSPSLALNPGPPNGPLSVKDWATFGVEVLGDQGSAELRECFIGKLIDSDSDASDEAVVSLAKRNDLRVLSNLTELLSQTIVSSQAVDATRMLLGMSDDCEGWPRQD